MIKKKQNAVKVSVVLALAVSITIFPVAVGSEQREEIRAICGYIPGCDAAEVFPSPDVVREKYHMTNADVADELVAISKMYGVGDTNECHRLIREGAITFIGRYGSTNNLPYLATIMTNRLDYAQKSAVGASFSVLRSSPDLTSFSSSIVTNAMMYSADIRNWVYSLMYGLCVEGKDDGYINNPAQHARIAAFFIEMAGAE